MMSRREWIAAVESLPGADVEPLHYLNAERGAIDMRCEHDYCARHAFRAAALLRRLGWDAYVGRASMGEDGARFCAIRGCGIELDGGGLTDDGINSALALTEADPFKAHVSVAEIVLSARSMTADDPRWSVWDQQAKRVLARDDRGDP